ncbi:URC4/urg3 family protein [Gordonia hongkongensis]|uniref:URC4/urg3 family protein n=1 Tax=Gordonia hongkongensis TaxID=1701090 RepID=A0AAX3T202_9ACTN|nr:MULTISPECIES: URC4/urg3 family protein [Gordonia]QIK47789.1 URC4/urg3 family protein [Gordonia terrae]MBN0974461.1 URC4/urg3 family protein [Gordonia sp. BP-119]MBN0984151.1 URC4/urg3 family protein [Gordonia sp. BP-94]WFP23165.1 URC4/urg3 family protein [Gordonia hongkongensis]WGJ83872.1 URC4/urg3 family protein [Gordonia sp. SMJS1]
MTGAPEVELSASQAARLLRSTATVRSRSRQLLERARAGESSWFIVHDDARDAAADIVVETTRLRYPDGDIPFHSRWRHFEAGGIDRLGALDAALPPAGSAERTRALIDVVLVSVLLDAGAGPEWSFRERSSDLVLTRSEGLGVASWVAFCEGVFSSDPADPLRVDATGLGRVTADTLGAAFQVGPDNPLTGLPGRVDLLRRLGEVLSSRPEIFGPDARPGGLFDHLTRGGRAEVPAVDILSGVLEYLGPIWPSDNTIDTHPLGDCWHHDAVVGPGLTAGWVPFHKLSQWLTYSLLEPFRWAGVQVTGLDELTGLPEYRNGGLLLDSGVLALREEAWADREWEVGDELVVEWRALTVALLDEIADLVRDRLDADAASMPLACVLEGGTWAAGRVLASRLRDGLPPLMIRSTGTVF